MAQLGGVEKQEFEYIRHGTQTLIVNWHVAEGKLIKPTIKATRTEGDFSQHNISAWHDIYGSQDLLIFGLFQQTLMRRNER